jgi:hypothetical protein
MTRTISMTPEASIKLPTGSNLLEAHERAERQQLITSYADKIDDLAAAAREGHPTNYHDFTAIRGELTKAGFSPPTPPVAPRINAVLPLAMLRACCPSHLRPRRS